MNDNIKEREDIHSLSLKEYYNVIYVPEVGVFDEAGNFIHGTGKRIYGTADYLLPNNEFVLQKPRHKMGGTVIWFGYLRRHYGHFLIDEMSRLWWLLLDSEKKYTIICDTGIDVLPQYYWECLSALGVECEKVLIMKEIVRLERILIPDLSYTPEKYIFPEYVMTFRTIIKSLFKDIKGYYPSKIYLSRRHFAKKYHMIEIGEYLIEEIFRDNGFDIIYPEELSFKEQLAYYHSCQCLASTNGSLAHNILWCRPNTEQIIINRFEQKNSHQILINKILKTPVSEINCYVQGSSHANSLFVVSKQLMEFCRYKNWSYKRSYLCKYWNIIEYNILLWARNLYRKMKQLFKKGIF